MGLTPGITFILYHIFRLVVPSVIFGFTLKVLSDRGVFGGYTLPTWLTVFGSLSFLPIIATIRIMYKSFDDRRQAAKLGARLARRIDGKSLGNVDILATMRRLWETGYIADGLIGYIGQGDPVVNLRILWSNIIFTVWPEHIKMILATDFPNYEKGKRFQYSMFSVLGSGVFNADGDMWKFHRSMTRPFFTRDRISDFDLFDRHATTVFALIKERMRSGHAIDFQDLMSRFTLDSATEFLFGHCVHSLNAGIPYPHNATYVPPDSATPQAKRANEFATAFAQAQEVISSRERYGWIWPMMEIFEDRTKKPMETVRAYLDPIIQDAIVKNANAPKTGSEKSESHVEEGETLIDHLVRLSSDPVVLRDETLNIMIAGRDTTAATLTFVIYLLAMHPVVHARLREEVLEKVGSNRRPDYDDIRDMKYLRAVINETLRLFPIVPFNTRDNIHATTWPSPDPTQKPIYIPAGTKIPYSVFLMHRRKDLWGPDAEEFDPDRFLDDRLKKYLVKNSFIFLPFNAGPRICLGQQFAYNEMSFMLIRLVQQFTRVTLDEAAAPPHAKPPAHWKNGVGRKTIERVYPKSHLTMYAQGGLWVRMTEAEFNA
ncbi:hypothetical protein H2248_002361 [Termitomyces sp. 'cryptogamus']|nr:hypothetical protein H2248_002361 [Termitomyces sp. 'cryptogamus']